MVKLAGERKKVGGWSAVRMGWERCGVIPVLPVLVAATWGPTASGQAEVGLFSSNDLIEFVLEADWDTLDDDRGQDAEERPGRVHWTTPDGRTITIPIEVKTRGSSRLKKSTCSFPPLRLDFPEKGAEGSVFNGQDKVKLVTHCQDRDRYEQDLLEEYLAYRIYNQLTDLSFRVRPARITYVDARGEDDPVTRLGFLIEDKDAMAARVGGRIVDVPGAPPSQFEQDQMGLLNIFQFMIGNTDWAMAPFHNMRALEVGLDYFPVPYDFDWSGLVDPPYAGPGKQVSDLIDSVRERLYRGECSEAIDYPATFARFQEQREAILALPGSVPGLSEGNQRSAVSYLEGFFKIIDSERSTRRQIVGACRR